MRRHQVLEQHLVHAQRRRQHAGAGVRHVEQLEQALDRAVLAEWPVQHREDGVGAEQPGARLEREGPAAATPAAVLREQHVYHLVARLGQAGAHRRSGIQGDVVLARAPAGQDGDPHQSFGARPVAGGTGDGVVGGAGVGAGAVNLPTQMTTVRPFFSCVPWPGR